MQLTRYTDYSLRVLIYLGGGMERLVTVNEIAENYGISRNHLVKVANNLVNLGYITAVRGKGGGLRLAHTPEEINIGALVRKTEGNFDLLECFDAETNTCPISNVCRLKGVIAEARQAFIAVLDKYSLADMLRNREQIIHFLKIAL